MLRLCPASLVLVRALLGAIATLPQAPGTLLELGSTPPGLGRTLRDAMATLPVVAASLPEVVSAPLALAWALLGAAATLSDMAAPPLELGSASLVLTRPFLAAAAPPPAERRCLSPGLCSAQRRPCSPRRRRRWRSARRRCPSPGLCSPSAPPPVEKADKLTYTLGKNARESVIRWRETPGAAMFAVEVNFEPTNPEASWTSLGTTTRRTKLVTVPSPAGQFLVRIRAMASDGTPADWSDTILATAR